LFGSRSYAGLDGAVITVFFIMAIGIPTLLWCTWRNHPEAHHPQDRSDAPPRTLRRWASGEFQTWTGPQKASQALVEILLPIAAVAIGITIFGLIFDMAARGVV
jgi:hypothetical protein